MNRFLLLLCIIPTFAICMEQQEKLNTLRDIDRRIFSINEGKDTRLASPYSSVFLQTLGHGFVVIEEDIIMHLYNNARERAYQLQGLHESTQAIDWDSYTTKIMNDRYLIETLTQQIHYINPRQYKVETSEIGMPLMHDLVMLPERGLFTLLQYSYGIKRTSDNPVTEVLIGKAADILLTADGSKTLVVGPYLWQILSKYRAYEQLMPQIK